MNKAINHFKAEGIDLSKILYKPHKNISEDSVNISDVEIILIEGSPDSIGEINYILERSDDHPETFLVLDKNRKNLKIAYIYQCEARRNLHHDSI